MNRSDWYPVHNSLIEMAKLSKVLLSLSLSLSLLLSSNTALAEEERPKIAVAYDIGFKGDEGFNDAVSQALELAKARYRLVPPFVREVPTSGTTVDRLSKLRFLAKNGYSLIIAVGAGYRDTLRRAATEYPNVQFALINDRSLGQLNISNIYFDELELARIAGVIAGAHSKRRVVAIIGATPDLEAGFRKAVIAVSKRNKVIALPFPEDVSQLEPALGKADVVYSLWDKDSRVFDLVTSRKTRTVYIARNPDQFFARIGTNPKVIASLEKVLTRPISQLVRLALREDALIDVIDESNGVFGRIYNSKNQGIKVRLGSAIPAGERTTINAALQKLSISAIN